VTTSRSLTLRLKPHPDGQSIAGWVVDGRGAEQYFAGWLGLLTLLEQARLAAACERQHGGCHEGTGRREARNE
jgi:hypothetical protein